MIIKSNMRCIGICVRVGLYQRDSMLRAFKFVCIKTVLKILYMITISYYYYSIKFLYKKFATPSC